jgi:hypothetical protein
MWNSESEKKEAMYVLEKIKKEFKKLKSWDVVDSKEYANRKNTGGRVYLTVRKI